MSDKMGLSDASHSKGDVDKDECYLLLSEIWACDMYFDVKFRQTTLNQQILNGLVFLCQAVCINLIASRNFLSVAIS